jgi:hypothetical protein
VSQWRTPLFSHQGPGVFFPKKKRRETHESTTEETDDMKEFDAFLSQKKKKNKTLPFEHCGVEPFNPSHNAASFHV